MDPKYNSLITSLSAATTAAVSYFIWRNPAILIGVGVLIAHEYGHYFTAKNTGANVNTQLFFSAIITMLRGTYMNNVKKSAKTQIALSGNVNGIIGSGLSYALAKLFGQEQMLLSIIGVGIREILSITIGSDG